MLPNSTIISDQQKIYPESQKFTKLPNGQVFIGIPNGQVFTGMGWVDEEGSISHLTTISNILSPEECIDECASNRKSNGQGCVAFTFVENIKRLA